MKLILRKNTSATSILLYLFNNYYLFSGKKEMKLASILELMKSFDKNESAVRMALSRSTKSGLLTNFKINNDVYYTLSDIGFSAILDWNKRVEYYSERISNRKKNWDNEWYGVNLNYIESKNPNRDKFVQEIQKLGFKNLSLNNWITPYDNKEKVYQLENSLNLNNHILDYYMKFNKLDDKLNVVKDIFKVEELKREYDTFLRDNIDLKDENILNTLKEEESLPILHSLGWSFFNIAFEDSVLPKSLLSSWVGDEAAAFMFNLKSKLQPNVQKYLIKINS
ncbi:hypothetical protein FZC66_09065 [Priestia megaterium]|nr:hypothetical protein FZC66_09065 [Priestia megaterium]